MVRRLACEYICVGACNPLHARVKSQERFVHGAGGSSGRDIVLIAKPKRPVAVAKGPCKESRRRDASVMPVAAAAATTTAVFHEPVVRGRPNSQHLYMTD